MTKIIYSGDCGNAPKMQYIYDFNVAFAKNDIEKIVSMLSEDAVWNMVGYKNIKGRSAIRTELEGMEMSPAKELQIDTIMSHGKLGAGNGEMVYETGKLAFCDVYEFTSHAKDAKIVSMTSYGVELKN